MKHCRKNKGGRKAYERTEQYGAGQGRECVLQLQPGCGLQADRLPTSVQLIHRLPET